MSFGLGVDFGTTNSIISIVDERGLRVLNNPETNRPFPSAYWRQGEQRRFAEAAKKEIRSGGSGAAIADRSPKRMLRHDGIREIGGLSLQPWEPAAEVIDFLRAQVPKVPAFGRKLTQGELSDAVFTVPVVSNGTWRRNLRRAADAGGFRIRHYVHEPLAAIYAARRRPEASERIRECGERPIVVVDWGGGTLDVTVCKFRGQLLSQVGNSGADDLGGDVVDELIAEHVVAQHRKTFPRGETRVAEGARGILLDRVEQAKIDLSAPNVERQTILVPHYYVGNGADSRIEIVITRDDLLAIVGPTIERAMRVVTDAISQAGLSDSDIALCVPVGGMVAMPLIRDALIVRFGAHRLLPLQHADWLVSEGAAWIAFDKAQPVMASAVRLSDAGGWWSPLIEEGSPLPLHNQSNHSETFTLRCVDPRSAQATLILTTGGEHGTSNPPSAVLPLRIDEALAPYKERITLNLSVDADYIVKATARSSIAGDEVSSEIRDILFGLKGR